AFPERTAIVDGHSNATPGFRIADANARAERQGPMRRRQPVAVSRVERAKSREVVGCGLSGRLHRQNGHQHNSRNQTRRCAFRSAPQKTSLIRGVGSTKAAVARTPTMAILRREGFIMVYVPMTGASC